MAPTPRARRLRRLAGVGGLVTLVVAALAATVTNAEAATVFSADFESGSTSGWSKSGGTWSIVSDGSQVLQQTDTGSERARDFAGSTSWTNYSVQARVKATSFASTAGVVALTARASGATKMYRLSLTGSNRVQLETMNGSSIAVLGSLSQTISTSTFYTLKLSVNGSTISGTVNGASVGSAGDSTISAGRIGLLTEHAAGRFDDVVVDDAGGSTPPTTTPTTPPTTTPTTPPTTTPTTPPTTTPPTSGALYVSPNGSASAAGTDLRPDHAGLGDHPDRRRWHDLHARRHLQLAPRPSPSPPATTAPPAPARRISAYPGETPVLNFSAQAEDPANRGLAVNGNYWHRMRLIVERAGDNGIFVGGSNNIIERTVTALQPGHRPADLPDRLGHAQQPMAGQQPGAQLRVARQRRLRR